MIQAAEVITLPCDPKRHGHQHHQMILGLDGDTEFEIEGSDNFVNPGQGCLVPSAAMHTFCGHGENRIFIINIPANTTSDNQAEKLFWPFTSFESLFDRVRYFNLDTQTQTLIQALSIELKKNTQDALLVNSCAYAVLNAVSHQVQNVYSHTRNRHLNLCVIDQYINLHLANSIHVDQLADIACVSVSRFHSQFRSKTGLSPHQYILAKRLQKARHYLSNSSMQLTDLACHCGFSSQSSFTQAFSKCFGISPARFRKLHS